MSEFIDDSKKAEYLAEYYMWMNDNGFDHNIKSRVVKKAKIFIADKQANGVDTRTEPALHKHCVMPRFSKEPLHISRGARTLNIKGFAGLKKEPTATVTCVEQWDDDGTGIYDESDDNQWATFYLRVEDIDPIINKLLEIKCFLNGA